MATAEPEELPKIGDWYLETDTEEEFQVIDVDEEEGMVEVQYFDGNIDSFAFADWKSLAPQPIEPPEDWTGPMDSLQYEDVDYDEEPSEHAPARRAAREILERDIFSIEEEMSGQGSADNWEDDD